MKLTTTLDKIRACNSYTPGWQTLLKSLGPDFDSTAEINLLTILESNGVADMLWYLRVTEQDSKRVAAQLAIEFAEEVLLIFEGKYPADQRPRKVIQAARDYLDGKISPKELKAYRAAAYAAADAANADAYADAYATAYAAYAAADACVAYAVAYADAYADAADAAYTAADAAYAAYAADTADAAYAAAHEKARIKQAEIIKKYLEW